MAAFRHALALGVTTLELDLQLTADRVPIVYHDRRIDSRRCRHEDGRPVRPLLVRDLRFDELRRIRCGTSRREPIPRLEQVLELIVDTPARLNLEIKQHARRRERSETSPLEAQVAAVVRAVERYALVDRTMVQAFNPQVLLAVRRANPNLELGILVKRRSQYGRMLQASQARTLLPRLRNLRQADVKRLRDDGIRVIPWTVNKQASIRRAVHWGVDGVVSDYPDRVMAILEKVQNPAKP